MGMWNDTCKCIDENWKALKARIQASITGITVNGVTHYQNDGTGICDLGEIEGTTDANEIFLKDGRSVETAIVTIDTALPGKVIEVEPSAVTNGINLMETDGNGTTARMLIRADDSLAFDGLQIGISDKTDTRITEALNTATTAGNKADDAQTDADSAMTAATTANGTANTALTKAEQAFTAIDELSAFVVTVNEVADTANTRALNAYELAHNANETAQSAYNGFGTSVVDTTLEATLDKGDGSSETKQLFVAGNNLSWNGNTLNAVGGAAYAAGDGITLADGAFSVNAGTGLQFNATDKSLEVDSSTTDALNTRVTNLETTASGLQTSVNALDTSVQTLDGEVDSLNTAVAGKQATITGGASTVTSSNLTASRALISNSSGKVAVSAVTSTELGYLDGVTSNVQTQLNNIVIQTVTGTASTSYKPTDTTTNSYATTYLQDNIKTAYRLVYKYAPYLSTTQTSQSPTANVVMLPTGLKIAFGVCYGFTNSTRYVPITVNMPSSVSFASGSSYTVTATIEDHDQHNLWGYTTRIRRISGTQFMVYVQNAGSSGSNISDDCKIHWIAIGY